MSLRVIVSSEANVLEYSNRSESESEQGVQLGVIDAKPSDLPMARLKFR